MTDWWPLDDGVDFWPSIDWGDIGMVIFLIIVALLLVWAGLKLLINGHIFWGLVMAIGGAALGLWQLGAMG